MSRSAATLPEPDDEGRAAAELVQRVGSGESSAEQELVERYSRGVLYLLKRLCGDPELAWDLHQETFRVVLERLRAGGIEDPERLAGFLRSTARNLAIGHHRKDRRRSTDSDSEQVERTESRHESALDRLHRHDRARAVRRTLAELETPRDREILFRFYLAEEEKEAICADLGLSSLHFNRVLFRARQRFKKILERAAESGQGQGARS